VCFCGFPIGQFYPIYQKLYKEKREKVCNEHQISENMLTSDLKLTIKTDDILNELGINGTCCRLHLITAQ